MSVTHRLNKGHNLGHGWRYVGSGQAHGAAHEVAYIVENPELPEEIRQRRVIFKPQPAAGDGAYEVSFIGVPHQVANNFLDAEGVERSERTNISPRAVKVNHVIPATIEHKIKEMVKKKVPRPLPSDLNFENRDKIGHSLRSAVFREMNKAGVIAPEKEVMKTYTTYSNSLSMSPQGRVEYLRSKKVTPDALRAMQKWVIDHYSPAFLHTVTSRSEGMDFWLPVEKMHDGFARAEFDAHKMEKA